MAIGRGIVKSIDSVGRIVLPKEHRDYLGLSDNDAVEIILREEGILLRRFQVGCVFCGRVDHEMLDLKGKKVCNSCEGYIIGDGKGH